MCVCVSLVKWNHIIAYDIKKNCVQLINGSVENGINSDWVISWMTTACWTITKRFVQAGQWAHDEWMRILVLRWYSVRVNMCVLSWWHSDGPECQERELLSLRFVDANECFLSSCHLFFFIFKFDGKRWTYILFTSGLNTTLLPSRPLLDVTVHEKLHRFWKFNTVKPKSLPPKSAMNI